MSIDTNNFLDPDAEQLAPLPGNDFSASRECHSPTIVDVAKLRDLALDFHGNKDSHNVFTTAPANNENVPGVDDAGFHTPSATTVMRSWVHGLAATADHGKGAERKPSHVYASREPFPARLRTEDARSDGRGPGRPQPPISGRESVDVSSVRWEWGPCVFAVLRAGGRGDSPCTVSLFVHVYRIAISDLV